MEFVCFSKFCAQGLGVFLLRGLPDGALGEGTIEAGTEFLGIVFQILHVLLDVFIAQACLRRKARRAGQRQNHG
jgi:hypothetical protein